MVFKELLHLNASKSTGLDGIPAKFLKDGAEVLKLPITWIINTCEPGHEKICLMSYANNKCADQPAHPRSLISAFVFRCLDSIISLDSIAEISRL